MRVWVEVFICCLADIPFAVFLLKFDIWRFFYFIWTLRLCVYVTYNFFCIYLQALEQLDTFDTSKPISWCCMDLCMPYPLGDLPMNAGKEDPSKSSTSVG